MQRSTVIFVAGLVTFAAVFSLSWFMQSWVLLYIASAIPLLIVPFMPEAAGGQHLDPERHGDRVRLSLADSAGRGTPDLLVIRFVPGYVQWRRKRLYIPLEAIRNASVDRNVAGADEWTASLIVLPHDCVVKKDGGPFSPLTLRLWTPARKA